MSQNDLVKTLRMNYLFDFYQSLLTDKQRNYLELFYLQDYALSEIADTFNVSRQAVYDNIRNRAFCTKCGGNVNITAIELSYAFKLLLDELKSLCINPSLKLVSKY